MTYLCFRARRRAAALLAPILLLAFGPLEAARAQQSSPPPKRYRNVVNQRFATVSDGPQSSLIVDVGRRATGADIARSVRSRVRADWAARGRALGPQLAALGRRNGRKSAGVLPVSTLVTVRRDGKLVIPARKTRAFGGGALTFTYSGWSAREEVVLRQFQEAFYGRIQNLYGAPAWSGNVEVVNVGSIESSQIPDVKRLAFGAFDVSNNRILLPSFESPESEALAFLLLMIHAFHGPAAFAYDAWEQGFARAAASVIARDPSLGLPDASANNLYSLLKFYDLLNQPALGNPTFFPPSQANLQLEGTFGIAKMLIPRMGMSGAAWLKVYIENQAFFRQFHEAYYAQFDPNAPVKLSGNVPALRAIAASIVPQVENVPFASWFERQFVLDSSVALGNKLYAFVVPSEVSQENGQSAAVVLVHFATQPDGDERLLNGRAYATYFDGTGARVNLGIQSEQTPLVEGEGFLTTLAFPTPGFDAGRITMDFHAGNETARTFLPSGFRGDFQGVVLGATAGSVRVLQRTLPPVQERGNGDSIDNGGFGVTLGTGPNELGVTEVTVTNADGNTVTTHRFNTGDGQYYAVVRVAGDVKTLKRTFRVQPGGVPVLVSFPLRPLQTDAAAALGLSPTDFLLSYWDPIRPGYQTFTVGQVGGATAPLQIGRGYWLKVAPSTGALQVEATLTGYEPAPGADVTVSLPYGWNLVGTPFEAGTEVRGLLVQYLQNDVRSWDQAVTDNLVASTIYGFDPAVGYVPLTSANNGRLEQWQGYWLRVLVPGGITLILPGSDSAGRATVGGGPPAPGDPAR